MSYTENQSTKPDAVVGAAVSNKRQYFTAIGGYDRVNETFKMARVNEAGGVINANVPGQNAVPEGRAYSNVSGDFTLTPGAGNTVLTLADVPFTLDEEQLVNCSLGVWDVTLHTVSYPAFTGYTIDGSAITFTGMGDFVFAAADEVALIIEGPQKAYDATLDANKVVDVAPVYGRYTDPAAYTLFTPEDTDYDEGTVINVQGYNTLNFAYAKSASDSDTSLIKVVYLIAAAGDDDYQEVSFGAPGGGQSVVSANVYVRAKEAFTEVMPISTLGMPFMRIDIAKGADDGTNATFTTQIVKAFV